MAMSLDSPLRSGSSSPHGSKSSPRGMTPTVTLQKAAQQAQQQAESIFQEICLHMDSAIKLFEKSIQKPKKKVEEKEIEAPIDINQESKEGLHVHVFWRCSYTVVSA